MRSAAFLSAAVVMMGLYLAAAAALALEPTAIGLGLILIAATTAVALVASTPRSEPASSGE